MNTSDLERLHAIETFPSLVAYLHDALDWPVESNELEQLTFDWNGSELCIAKEHEKQLRGGVIRQLRPMANSQPWGIFLIEFAADRVHRSALRQILRGLVPNRRRDPHAPTWHHENLLFICATGDYGRFTFAHFRGESPQKARLTTFGWERNSSYIRTLCEFNLPALRWPEDPSDVDAWLKQWIAAFDKEPLTREFFKRFDKSLERIKSDLEQFQGLSSGEAYSRAQLLLERLIFLYFLQNRGWLNRKRDYLLAHFTEHGTKSEEFTYYEVFLERLFWTLSSAPGSPGRLEGVPFLNGGLFDDDEFSGVVMPVRRKENPPLRVRNASFEFAFEHLLEAFNFTVREDTPLNQDVAVDPEMLGKVFESIVLHAEAEADYNAPDKRKATGSYYTPRIVVHFICREALRQYLGGQLSTPDWVEKLRALFEIDPTDGVDVGDISHLKGSFTSRDGRRLLDLLKQIKMCDPAVGSGAFPVGLLHELVNLRRLAETIANGFVDPARREGSNWIHQTKADIVENCLYGVDIQQQAIEICRLRLWLSLIVDYDLGLDPFEADPAQFRQAIQNISQLPNLEMNFRRGDSLLDCICGVPVRIEASQQYEKEYERIRRLGRDLHNAKKAERKRDLRVQILHRRLDLSERVLSDEGRALDSSSSQLALSVITETETEAAQRRRIEEEITRIKEALRKVAADRRTLDKVAARPFDSRFYPELRKLEGADFDAPFNFSWRIDFADIFNPRPEGASVTLDGEFGLVNTAAKQQKLTIKTRVPGGFDLILGNPPFVTARNPEKRDLYRERWRRVCYKNYLLVCPFFDLSFGLLRPGGQIGFIVSNAFAKREFGKPLIEKFFPTVDVRKVVDCSGLMFPGHGTPTCIVFGRNQAPLKESAVRIATTLPGGGDLRTAPEESPLWTALEQHHDEPNYRDDRISVRDVIRRDVEKWPWDFLGDVNEEAITLESLGNLCAEPIGAQFITGKDEAYVLPGHYLRRLGVPTDSLRPYATGEDVRNWSAAPSNFILFPYDINMQPLPEPLPPGMRAHLSPFREILENCVISGSIKKKETNLKWFEYRRLARAKFGVPLNIVNPHIATHCHFVVTDHVIAFKEKAIAIALRKEFTLENLLCLSGWLNSNLVLEVLRRECFSKRAGEDEERDWFEFAGEKLRALSLPDWVASAVHGRPSGLARQLQVLSRACWQRGQQLSSLTLKKLFEKSGEAYHSWNASLPGYVPPDPRLDSPFQSMDSLKDSFSRACTIREEIRAEMIALQEEMDWLVYAGYGLIPLNSPALGIDPSGGDSILENPAAPRRVAPIQREQRPFVLWADTGGDLKKASCLIPSAWSKIHQALWRGRLEVIQNNERIGRLEQPAYKRRWDEQWKAGVRWQRGPIAYDAELADAFDWWLSEKAEWWLEKKVGGGPIALEKWSAALWKDPRVQAGWCVICEALERLDRRADFARYFAALIKEQSVPDNIPVAVPWEKINTRVPANVKRIRGKLNVPRERFRVRADESFVWAGMQTGGPGHSSRER